MDKTTDAAHGLMIAIDALALIALTAIMTPFANTYPDSKFMFMFVSMMVFLANLIANILTFTDEPNETTDVFNMVWGTIIAAAVLSITSIAMISPAIDRSIKAFYVFLSVLVVSSFGLNINTLV